VARPVDPSTITIPINPGWNWIGYPLNHSLSVNTALSNITPADNDMIKSQDSFATFVNGSWQGGLKTLEPGKGYIYLSNQAESFQLIYPSDNK
jgi:hypothetical protein